MSDADVFEIQPNEDVLLVAVTARVLDDHKTEDLIAGVLDAADKIPGKHVALDMSRVKFAPSVAIGALVQIANSLKLESRRVALIAADRKLRDTIRVTQVSKLIDVHDDLAAFTHAMKS